MTVKRYEKEGKNTTVKSQVFLELMNVNENEVNENKERG
jgi:hypothetical protein